MRLTRALALTAAAALLAGCNDGAKDTAATDLPDVVTTTSAAAAPTSTATKAPAKATPTALVTASPTPTAVRTSARPVAAPTTGRPTPRPTTAKPTPKPTKPPATGTVQLTIQNYAFSPQVFTIPRGTTVRATNKDLAGHTWTSNSGVWDSGNLATGQSYSYRFMTTGTFNFVCSVPSHDMTGRVTIR